MYRKNRFKNNSFRPNRSKLYAIARRVNGKLYCQIDASICSMGWSDEACYVYRSVPQLTKEDMKKGIFVVRVHSKTSPIIVNLSQRWPNRTKNNIFQLKPLTTPIN